MRPKDPDSKANSVNSDQEQSDLGLHSLPRHVCPNHDGSNFNEQVGRFHPVLHDGRFLIPVGTKCNYVAIRFMTAENCRFQPFHDKTNKMICAASEDLDQPGHPPSLIRVFAVRSMGS